MLLDGNTLTIDAVIAVARDFTKVKLTKKATQAIRRAADFVQELVDTGSVVYGVTTGFGPFANTVIPDNKARELQQSLLISHAAGVGEPLPTEVVRAAMLLRANTLAKGYSGIRLKTLENLIILLNKGIHPVIPSKGSVGASGDLAPLAHMALVLIGEGEVEYQGEIISGAEALQRVKLSPITLDRKEGIALINGTQVMTAIAALGVADAQKLVGSAEIAAALSVEALEGVQDAFDSRIHKIRPHSGQARTAKHLRALLSGSSLVLTSHQRDQKVVKAAQQLQTIVGKQPERDHYALTTLLQKVAQAVLELDKQLAIEPEGSAEPLRIQRLTLIASLKRLGLPDSAFEAAYNAAQQSLRVQDAYSLRCTPQVLGAARDAIEYAAQVVTTEINSATDNPLVFPEEKVFLSGGNFHGQPVAIAMDLLAIAVTSIGTIAERRIARLVDDKLSEGLPLLLLKPRSEDRGVHYGLGLAQITAAALAAECQILSTPASVTTIPTSANQEDHVSMGTIAARQAREVVNNVEHIVASELLCAAQGVDIRAFTKQVKLGQGTTIALKQVRETVPRHAEVRGTDQDRLTHDVLVHRDLTALWRLVHSGELLREVKVKTSGFDG